MAEGGSLSGTFGWLVGTGPGAGMALVVIFAGVLASLVGVAGFLFSAVRNADELLPDHQQNAEAPAAAQMAEGAVLT